MNTPRHRQFVDRLKTIHFSPSLSAPALIFLGCFFLFGIWLSNLGYFQDDWHHVYYAYHEGTEGLKNFFYTDSRPLAYGLYGLLFGVLGFDPARWHWSLMLLRFLTAVGFWLMARLLWPEEDERTTWLALFFALHPVYTLQPLAAAYTLHWVSYLAIMFSFFLTVFSIRKNGKSFWLFLALALVLQTYHLMMMEYFSGLELVRVLFLWLALPHLPLRQRANQTILLWLPYLLILILYAAYRLSYSKIFGYDRFEPALLSNLANNPVSTLLLLLQNILKDSIYTLVSPWYTAIEPSVFDLTRPFTWYMLAASAGVALLVFCVVSRLTTPNSQMRERSPTSQVAVFGFLALILALLPSWLVGFEITEKNPLWSSRLALPAMLGASLLLVGLTYFFIQSPTRRNIFLSILLGIAASSHLQTGRAFQESWEKQRQFYWQLHWRAPALRPGTLLVADNEILFYMGDYPTAYAINLLYPKTTHPPQVDYWFNPGSANIHMLPFEQGQPLEMTKYSSSFTASIDRVLAITFEPQQGQCLWLLRPAYREVRFLTEEAYRWMAYSDISRAQPTESAPPAAIFGKEPPHNWCYHYQKADLAAQAGDWADITALWESALTNNLTPSASIELLPFIEAYAQTSQWEQARELTLWANSLPPRMPDLLCTTWRTYEKNGLLTPANASIFANVKNRLNCQ
jgi:hypothetical protein